MAINGVFLAVVGFAICAVLALLFAGPFFRSQTQIDYIVENGTDYLLVCCCGSLGLFCEIMFERLLQGTGRSILSMYTQGLGAIVNIVLDPIFIFVLDMGVTGAAVATVIGQFCGCILALIFNLKKNDGNSPAIPGLPAQLAAGRATSTPSACPASSWWPSARS